MSDIVVFDFRGQQVRTDVGDNGEPLFCASDVARVLGYARPNDAVTAHCDGTVKRRIIDSMGRKQTVNFIPESDVYRLIFRSKLPEAKEFERWTVEEVLPAIRKAGGYSVRRIPQNYIEALEAHLEDQRMIAGLIDENKEVTIERDIYEKQTEAMLPAYNYGTAMLQFEDCLLISTFSKKVLINGRHIGPHKIFEYLRKHRILMNKKTHGENRHNEPFEKYIRMGLFYMETAMYLDGNGRWRRKVTPKITVKGEAWLVNFMLKDPDFYQSSILYNGVEYIAEKNPNGPQLSFEFCKRDDYLM